MDPQETEGLVGIELSRFSGLISQRVNAAISDLVKSAISHFMGMRDPKKGAKLII